MTHTADRTPFPRPLRRWPALALGLTLLGAVACTDGSERAGPISTSTSLTGRVTGTAAEAGGWLGGRPEFTRSGGDEDAALADAGGEPASASRAEVASSMPPTTVVGPPGGPAVDAGLRAGAIDDNLDYDGFLAYVQRVAAAGIAGRAWDPSGRIVLTVTTADGGRVPGVAVEVASPAGPLTTLRTTSDGTLRFLPVAQGAGGGPYTFRVDDHEAQAAPGSSVSLSVGDRQETAGQPPAIDVLFLLDATGSMGDEIDRLTANIDRVASTVSAAVHDADLRFGMTLYRDLDDSFVTATYDFTDDVDAFGAALDEVVADGGGDYPEALDEGLAEALLEPSWRPAGDAVQLIFVVADAPPQVGRDVQQPYTESLQLAMERGIKVFPIASSGTDDTAELVFRQLAQATGARLVFLAYGAGGAALGTSSDINETDYEELSLDALVTRLIVEEIGQRTGTQITIPTVASTTSTTRPPGQ